MSAGPRELLEISDLVVAYDPETLARQRVRRDHVVARLHAAARPAAARMVAAWPVRGGDLDEEHVDDVLLRAHHELQRLSEEFRQGERSARLLRPLIAALRATGQVGRVRVVDVGCGLGYVVRWLAAHGRLGADVELVGCDYNARLLGFAQRLAEEEGLACRFQVANAFRLSEPATIYLSTGVIHHFRGPALGDFLRAQTEGPAQAFLHADIKPTYLAPLGAWLFHRARMREPLAQHDGVVSALRAHPGEELRAAAGTLRGWTVSTFDGARERLPVLHVMQTFVGLRPSLRAPFVTAMGRDARRLGPWSEGAPSERGP